MCVRSVIEQSKQSHLFLFVFIFPTKFGDLPLIETYVLNTILRRKGVGNLRFNRRSLFWRVRRQLASWQGGTPVPSAFTQLGIDMLNLRKRESIL